MITELRHTGIVVSNLNKALHFWRDLLGFSIVKKMYESGAHLDAIMGLNNVKITTIKMSAPCGALIELLYFHSHKDKKKWQGKPFSTGYTHIALTVSDLDHTCEKLLNAGFEILSKPQFSPDKAVKLVYCRGFEGSLIELVQVLKS